ncbi:MAG: DUF5640 domain-containing protein [Oscillospiraceae bacterium]|nr:DUF5640 domain-containing protein [Oscillospiraceae bacterium]
MKKMIAVVLLLVLIVGGLAACGGTHDLVGTWSVEGGGSLSFTFNEDGTGVEAWGGSEGEAFTWSASSGNVTVEFEEWGTEVFSYTIDGDRLTLDDGEEELSFTRQ